MYANKAQLLCVLGFLAAQNWTALADNKGDYGRMKFRNCHLTNVADLVAGEFAGVPSGK